MLELALTFITFALSIDGMLVGLIQFLAITAPFQSSVLETASLAPEREHREKMMMSSSCYISHTSTSPLSPLIV